jgi:hypothetical protein
MPTYKLDFLIREPFNNNFTWLRERNVCADDYGQAMSMVSEIESELIADYGEEEAVIVEFVIITELDF